MMPIKKYSLFLISIIIFTLSCSEPNQGYTEYRAFPVPEKLEINPGNPSFLAMKIEIPANHYIYGNPKGPGTGKSTELRIEQNTNFEFKTPQYLPAEKYTPQFEKKHINRYQGATYVFLPVRAKKDARPGSYTLKIKLDVLMCSTTTCIPQNNDYQYTIQIMPAAIQATEHDLALLDLFQKSAPPGLLEKSEHSSTANQAVTGNNSFNNTTFSPVYAEHTISGLLQAIIFGIIAGFILNFMPCVLPVVSIKLMGFVQHAQKSRKQLTMLTLLFSLGIITSFMLLATLAAFFGYSWGGLFQNKLFIIGMAGVVFALALSFFDLYTISVPSVSANNASAKNQYFDSFTKGIFATLLATPCSGPFLGGTLAWTLSRPPIIIFIIFMSIGLGMALPYILITLSPAFLKIIPKPGKWMKTFEQVMAFLLLFTVIYLLGILESAMVLPAITFMGFIAMGFWQFGRFGAIFQSRPKRIISFIALVVILIAGYQLSFNYIYKSSAVAITSASFSEEKLYQNRDKGVITLLKFTADWCPNCKLVEKISLQTPKIADYIKTHKIDFISADLTRPFPAAEKLMQLLGNKSIPFLVIFPSGDNFSKPICLRDIYSEDDVLKALKTALDKSKSQFDFSPGKPGNFKLKINGKEL